MGRHQFGAGIADFIVAPADGIWTVGIGVEVTFWDSPADGAQYTDLLDSAGSPITQVVSDEHGALPRFVGPDGVMGMWADAGGGTRAWIGAQEPPPGTRLGIYMPDSWGQRWKTARASAATGGKARVLAVGDSLVQGWFASNLHTSSWVGLLRTELQALYGDGGSGFFSTSRSDPALSASAPVLSTWKANGSAATLTGTWSLGPQNFGPGITFITASAAATATFKVTGSIVKIFSIDGAAPRAAYTYSIDGAAPVTVTPVIGATAIRTVTVTGLTAGTHTVTISWAGATGDVLYLVGVAGETASGIVVDNLGRAGSQSAHWAVASPLNSPWNGGTSYPADLVIVSVGLNDANNAVATDTWMGNLHTYLQAVRAATNGATDILIVAQHLGNFGGTNLYLDYVSRLRGVAEAYGAALVDMWALGRTSYAYWSSLGYWGSSTAAGVAGTDAVHASDAGHAAIASQILPILTA